MLQQIVTLAFGWQLFRFPLNTVRKLHNGFLQSKLVLHNSKSKSPQSCASQLRFQFGIWKQPSPLLQMQVHKLVNLNSAYRRFSTSWQHLSMAGLPYPGQGLKKKVAPEPSKFLQKFIENRKREQEWGKKYFPAFPDLLFYVRLVVLTSSGILLGWIFYPNFAEYSSSTDDPTLVYDSAMVIKPDDDLMLKAYTKLPLRLMSRVWGRFNSGSLPVSVRPYLYGLYSKVFDVNMDEALEQDLKSYDNFSQFFRRAIKSSVRPIDETASIVSPCDGKILHFGDVVNGAVEQVKGITYSLQKFLGPLTSEPVHDNWGRDPTYVHNWSLTPLPKYMRALMHHPDENKLFHCVIYLAPGDYHRFHSPADWNVQHRRHFPGDLLSVNPKIASWIPNLFVLNERVVLSGKWEHGFFSMTAVGATNVGSVEVYGDVTLNTNRPKRVHGAYYDKSYDDVPVKKGVGMGEFNLGSTIVLIFEAPTDFQYCIEPNEKILYGRALQK